MICIKWMTVLLLLQGSQSYVLLTANLDDIHTVLKQISESPVAGQINRILRRASTIFNQQLRAADVDGTFLGSQPRFPRTNPQTSDSSLEPLQDNRIERRGQADEARSNNNIKRRSESSPTDHENQDSVPHDYVTDQTSEIAPRDLVKATQKELEPLSYQGEGSRKDEDTQDRDSTGDLQTGDQENDQDESDEDSHKSEQRDEIPRVDLATRRHTEEMVALGRNASNYLDSIKKIMEDAA